MLHERTEKFNSLVIDLEQHYKEINGKTEESHTLVLGQIVLVAEHSTFFRGEIIDFQAEYIKLRLIDVGKVLTKALSDAKNAPSKFLSIDPFTFPIKLPQKAKTLEVGDKVKIKYSGLNIKQADLALENIQVRQYMIDSSPTKESTSYITKAIKYNEERCLIGSIIYCSKFPLRTPIKVRVVDFSQLLLNQVITGYLEDRQNHIHYRELRKNIQEYCEQDNLDTNYLPM